MPTKTNTSNGTAAKTRVDELLKSHRELVALYPTQHSARKAQTSRKLNLVQLELDMLDVEYPFWTKPEPVVTRSYVYSPEELVARIENLRAQMERTDRPESHKTVVDRELTNALEMATKRGIEVCPSRPSSRLTRARTRPPGRVPVVLPRLGPRAPQNGGGTATGERPRTPYPSGVWARA